MPRRVNVAEKLMTVGVHLIRASDELREASNAADRETSARLERLFQELGVMRDQVAEVRYALQRGDGHG